MIPSENCAEHVIFLCSSLITASYLATRHLGLRNSSQGKARQALGVSSPNKDNALSLDTAGSTRVGAALPTHPSGAMALALLVSVSVP